MSVSWQDDDEDFKLGGRTGFRSKPRFSFPEVKMLLDAVKKNRHIILSEFREEESVLCAFCLLSGRRVDGLVLKPLRLLSSLSSLQRSSITACQPNPRSWPGLRSPTRSTHWGRITERSVRLSVCPTP